MAETFTGKLSFDKGKWKIVFFDEKKQKDSTLFCQKNIFASDFEPKESEETEVDFERDSTPQKSATNIRAKGKAWVGERKQPAQVDYSQKNPVPYSDKSKFGKPKDFKANPPKGEAQTMKREFHNPYNFVPAIPRDHIDGNTNELGDREPSGHDRYISDLYSGKLRVKMRVETPLLLPDTARVGVKPLSEGKVHKTFPVRLVDGQPYIEPTAIKGMLRSAYEAVTNSRMAIFSKHEDRLAFRPEAGQGASVVPVKIEKKNGTYKVVFYTGSNEITDLQDNGAPKKDKPLCAAWLPRYFRGKLDNQAPKYGGNTLPTHKDEVEVWIEKFEHYKWNKKRDWLEKNSDFVLWRVREITLKGKSLKPKPSQTRDIGWDNAKSLKKSYYKPLGIIERAEGIVFVSNHNMQNKHDEKVFFKPVNAPQPETLTKEKWHRLKEEWRNLVENYQELHKDEKRPPQNLRISNWSRHIPTNKEEATLKSGSLCFAQVSKNGQGNFEVERLFPVMISRQLFDYSPLHLLEKNLEEKDLGLTLADDRNKLSPADRVFGFVNQNGQGAYRGQVRIGIVTCTNALVENFDSLPLNIMGQPKPQQGRFYVAEGKSGEAQPEDSSRNNEQAGYDELSKGLRGRKVYPHHSQVENQEFWFTGMSPRFDDDSDDYWKNQFKNSKGNAYYREYLRPTKFNKDKQKDEQQRDSQNRSIQGWVKKDTTFEFDIHFTNLSKFELGALLWLLQLKPKQFHRFGGAKPLGFGSVHLSLKEETSDIRAGAALKQTRYASLNEDEHVFDSQQLENNFIKAFRDAVAEAYGRPFEEVSFIKAFIRCCEGFNTGLPIHYPRGDERPNPEGESFKWFVDNSSRDGFRLPLPDLHKREEIKTALPRKPKR